MHDLAVEEVGHGGEPDMRMRAHVDALAEEELGRPHLVEEDERPDHLPLRRRQRAAHLEAAEIAGARHDHGLDRIAGGAVARLRIIAGCQLMVWPSRCPQNSTSRGTTPAASPPGPTAMRSIRAVALARRPSQCFFSASPRS